MNPIKILLADDHQIVLDGMLSILEEEEDFQVIGQARDGKETIERARQLKPDVVLLDLDMPVMNGIVAGQKIKKQFPEIKVIILSLYAEKSVIQHMLQIGVDAYLVKNSDKSEVLRAIREVASGKKYFSADVTLALSNIHKNTFASPALDLQEKLSSLSKREIEVLKWIAQGYSNKEIATKLHLSSRTIDAHRANLMKKLDLHKITGLVRFAVKVGLVD